MVQQVQVLLHKPGDLGSIPETHMKMERKVNSTKMFFDLSILQPNIFPKKMKLILHKDSCAATCLSSLSTIATVSHKRLPPPRPYWMKYHGATCTHV